MNQKYWIGGFTFLIGLAAGVAIGFFMMNKAPQFTFLSQLDEFGKIDGKVLKRKDLSEVSQTKVNQLDQVLLNGYKEVLEMEFLDREKKKSIAKNAANAKSPEITEEQARLQLEALKDSKIVAAVPEEERVKWMQSYLKAKQEKSLREKTIKNAWEKKKIESFLKLPQRN